MAIVLRANLARAAISLLRAIVSAEWAPCFQACGSLEEPRHRRPETENDSGGTTDLHPSFLAVFVPAYLILHSRL